MQKLQTAEKRKRKKRRDVGKTYDDGAAARLKPNAARSEKQFKISLSKDRKNLRFENVAALRTELT